MIKKIRMFIAASLLAAIGQLFCGCGGDLPSLDDKPIHKSNRGVYKTNLNDSSTIEVEQESTNNTYSGDKFKLSTTKVNEINTTHEFPFNSMSKPHILFIEFLDKQIVFKIKESGINWINTYNIQGEPNGKWRIDGVTYTINTQDSNGDKVSLTLDIDNTNNINYIKVGDITYFKHTQGKVSKSATKKVTSLKYMDNHTVEVQKNQTLKVLVELYKEDNKHIPNIESLTISEVCKFNKLNSKCTVHIGQIIKFPDSN